MATRNRRLALQFRFARLQRWLAAARAQLSPPAHVWRGASRALWLLAAVLVAVQAGAMLVPAASTWTLLATVGLAVAVVLVALLAAWSLRLAAWLPAPFLAALATAVVAALLLFGPMVDGLGMALAVLLLVAAVLAAGGGWAGLRQPGTAAAVRLAAALWLAGGSALLLAMVVWWLGAGPGGQVALPDQHASPFAVPVGIGPADPGPWQVSKWSYGSGSDRHRVVYGKDARFQLPPVDGRPFVAGWDGLAGRARTAWFGFGPEALPLQGQVWQPVGPGPFPMVLVVHGNHSMQAPSDDGYGWLGRLLASRGHVVVSIDQNFLNGSVTDLLGGPDGGLEDENDARGWLLLEHLRQWRSWTDDPGHPLAGLVDLSQVALVGHSRGGEAAAVAALFNGLARYPEDASVAFDYGFGIRAVVALAPIDGRYRPAGSHTPLTGVSYLLLHGGMDGDVTSLEGQGQYHRLAWAADGDWRMKASAWLPQANHGQFNTVWGVDDAPAPWNRLLNLADLQSGVDQRATAAVLLSAFLDATLGDDRSAAGLFLDPRVAVHWMPEGQVLARADDSTAQPLVDAEEDLDPGTTVAGGLIAADGVALWREQELHTERGGTGNRVVVIGWQLAAGAEPAYWQVQPAGGLVIGDRDLLALDVAALDLALLPDAPPAAAPGTALELELVLRDGAGQMARVALDRFAPVPVQPRRPVAKPLLGTTGPMAEPLLQTWVLPASWFRRANPRLQLTDVRELRLAFTGGTAGVVAVDNLRLLPAASPLARALRPAGTD